LLASLFFATFTITYSIHIFHENLVATARERHVDRTMKGDKLDNFAGQLSLNPEMFPDSACNPDVPCPWAKDPELRAGPRKK